MASWKEKVVTGGGAQMFLFFGLISVVQSITVIQSHYVLNPICSMQERIDNGCAAFVSVLRSSAECMSVCNRDDSCVGSSFSGKNECFIHNLCPSTTSCNEDSESYMHFVRSDRPSLCSHGNRWDVENGQCLCRNGWIGDYCEELAHTCDQVAAHGYPDGDHRVTLDIMTDGSVYLNVTCAISESANGLAILLRHRGSGDLNRSWEEFVKGFADDSDLVLWMGLEDVYLLNQAGHDRLHVLLEMVGYSTTQIRRIYKEFRIKDASREYEFTYDSAIGDGSALGGCLNLEKNVPFSTWDSDNDDIPSDNCASKHGAGWWYPASCDLPCNLMAYKAGDALQNIDSSTMSSHFDTLYILLRKV